MSGGRSRRGSLSKLYSLSEGVLPPTRLWPRADILSSIESAKTGPFGMKKDSRTVAIPLEVRVPVGLLLYHGTSSGAQFKIPTGPGSFSLDLKTAQGYADNEGEGISPRIQRYTSSNSANCVDHPGVGPGQDDASEWLGRWQREVMMDTSVIRWRDIGIARVPEALNLFKQAGYDGIRIAKLDDGGEEVCYFDPVRFVKNIDKG